MSEYLTGGSKVKLTFARTHLPPSEAVIVDDDECEHYFQSRSVRIDFAVMQAMLESTTHESTGRLIYTVRAVQCPLSLIPPARRRLVLSTRLPKRTLITDLRG